ncbi:butyrophilin subfamily 1 member A1 isoform X2 [Rhinichthys klamathensis goyatoka]|uniref:butyrophilin subfamily 1 member A1 isoform X2 n=1 Tax=Rhinichthys klamathensis goyatoka TaxID=3034132 RepID=UPI0024B524E9|nr:butyrophilin subfamily 1 member A1 isoform X2 [Rhinichthys klamathensis goyatoka]
MSLKRLGLYTHRCSLALVMILVLVTATTDVSGPPVNITAVLGHTATFKCPWDSSFSATRLYIQRVVNGGSSEIFINGFDSNKKSEMQLYSSPKYLNRTKVNRTDLSMEMTDVSVSDEGLYKCYIFYGKVENPTVSKPIPEIYLKVTAKYSVPTIEKECTERKSGDAGKSCQLSCSSTGGYPQSAVKWAELNLSLISVIHNESSEDLSSKTWTVNQTITYNCDHPTNVSCAVDDAVSPTITICETESFSVKVIAAIVFVLVFVPLLLLVLLVMKHCYQRCRTEDQGDPENADVALALRASET